MIAGAVEFPNTLPALPADSRRIPHAESSQLPDEVVPGSNVARAIHAFELNEPGIANVVNHQFVPVTVPPSPRQETGDEKPEPKGFPADEAARGHVQTIRGRPSREIKAAGITFPEP